MSEIIHKPGIHEAFRVKRHLKLQYRNDDRVHAIIEQIRQLDGVDTVELDGEARWLNVAYDASKLQFGQLTDMLREHGIEPEQGWWARCRYSWYGFTDQNIRDNARHEPHCCNKAPTGK